MIQICTTLADRRRPGPAAFRRKHRELPYATLSFPRWSSFLATNLRGGGGAPVPSFKDQVYTYTEPAEKETISKRTHTILMKLCMWIESADV